MSWSKDELDLWSVTIFVQWHLATLDVICVNNGDIYYLQGKWKRVGQPGNMTFTPLIYVYNRGLLPKKLWLTLAVQKEKKRKRSPLNLSQGIGVCPLLALFIFTYRLITKKIHGYSLFALFFPYYVYPIVIFIDLYFNFNSYACFWDSSLFCTASGYIYFFFYAIDCPFFHLTDILSHYYSIHVK